jgi:hypothetical protein
MDVLVKKNMTDDFGLRRHLIFIDENSDIEETRYYLTEFTQTSDVSFDEDGTPVITEEDYKWFKAFFEQETKDRKAYDDLYFMLGADCGASVDEYEKCQDRQNRLASAFENSFMSGDLNDFYSDWLKIFELGDKLRDEAEAENYEKED